MVPLKYLINIWRLLKMPLIHCEINLMLTWSKNCFLIACTLENENSKFTIADTKLYVSRVTLSTQDNVKLLKQLESVFKRTINCNKYQSKVTQQTLNRNLDFLIDPSVEGVNRTFVLSFEDRRLRESYKQYFLPTVEIKDYNVLIERRNFFDQPVKNNSRTYDNIRKIAIGQGGSYITDCFIYYPYFKNYYKVIAIDLSKQQKLDADPKAIQ